MCTAGDAIGLVQSVGSNILSAKAESKNLKYKTQIALNNAKSAQNEALRQQQLGIEEARKEKIEGIKEANLQTAKNAASGLDAASSTSIQNYQDTIDTANANAASVKNQYDLKADSYFDSANSYLNQINEYNNSYNASLYSNAINSLGSVGKVAGKWYESKKEGKKEGRVDDGGWLL